MAGSIVGAVARAPGLADFARGLQGLGGGGLMILSQAMIADVILPAIVAATWYYRRFCFLSRRWLVR